MNTTTTQALFFNSSTIANEFAKTGRIVNKKSGFFPTKPKSQATIQKERIEAKYTSRKNICEVCFTAKSNVGTCMC